LRTRCTSLILSLLWTLLTSCNVPTQPSLPSTSTSPPRTTSLANSTPSLHTKVKTSTSPSPGPTRTTTLPASTELSVQSPTPRPEHAPALPHLDVHFITNGNREQPTIALTFDLCQRPSDPTGFDDGILGALIEYHAPATFFLGGDWMRTHPEETLTLADNPLFELGNHSWSHPDFRDLAEAEMSSEILRTQELMYQLTGRQTRLFRLPGGTYNDLALSVVAWHGLYTIQWDVVTADPVPDNTAENMLQLVKERVQNGSILIMHANGRGWHSAEALPLIIDHLRSEGYTLVTVSQLIGLAPQPTPEP
jgi:peptidoglycan/xylan/chitin deacetylase (PgdA/CDA1 family)